MFDNFIENEKDNLINELKNLIKYPSVSNEESNDGYPFGKDCHNCLEYILDLANKMGFRTKNIDDYCGYIEFGKGSELVGIIGHLDVVPANKDDGWSTDPFDANIRDSKIYGRGSIDDKGPVIASLYAMKAIKDSVKINKRVRLILGLNEEKSWKCIEYYKAHEEHPIIGFSPDANFPGIFAEKGILSLELKNLFNIKNYEIIDINCNNNALNVVPKYASIILKGENKFKERNNIKITSLDNQTFKIESFGKASHAAHPEDGINAIEILIKYLLDNFEFDSDYLFYLYNNGLFKINSPDLLKIDNKSIVDESGELTSNVARLEYNNRNLIIKINLRIPVTYSIDSIISKYMNINNRYQDFKLNVLSTQEPLYRKKDSYLVKTLVDIFNKKANLNSVPIAIGGGTYARAFDNFISYGATMPGEKDMCHQVDEYIKIDDLLLSCKIYADAIYELAK